MLFLISFAFGVQVPRAQAEDSEVSLEQYRLAQGLLSAKQAEEFYLARKTEFEKLAEQDSGRALLGDAFKKLNSPAWSKEISSRWKISDADFELSEMDEPLASTHLKQAEQLTQKKIENPSVGKWIGLGALAIFFGTEYMKNKRFIVTGLRY